MTNDTIKRDEFETVKQLLASAASYAESANRQVDRNAEIIRDNAEAIRDNNKGIAELKKTQDRTQAQIDANAEAIRENNRGIAELKTAQDRTQQQLDSFIFESQRLMLGHAEKIQELKGISERLEAILSYLVRKEGSGE